MMKNQTLSYLWKTIFFFSFYVVPKPKEDDIIVWVKKRNICDPYVLNGILTHDHKHAIFFPFFGGGVVGSAQEAFNWDPIQRWWIYDTCDYVG